MADTRDIINDLGGINKPMNDLHAIRELLKDGAGGSSYSTDEKKVGTWIDGSDLYQKTFYRESAEAYGNYEEIGVINGKIVNVAGQVTRIYQDNNFIYPLSSYEDNRYYFSIRIDNGKIKSHILFSDAVRQAKDLIITVQYVKDAE